MKTDQIIVEIRTFTQRILIIKQIQMKRFLLIPFLILSYSFTSAQDFEGIITFSISYEALPDEMKDAVAMLPKEQTFYIKNNKSKFIQNSSMSSTVVISDSNTKTSTVLMDAMGQKYKMTIDTDELSEIENVYTDEIKIDYVDETKTIAGYTCKKAIVVMEGFDQEAVFYYTEEIAPLMLSGMEGLHLKGLPLEYNISMDGMTMVMRASEVKKTTVPDSTFDIPAGYTEMPDYMKDAMQQKDN